MKSKKPTKSKAKYWFLAIVILIYLITSIINKTIIIESLVFFKSIFLKLIPIFVFVFILMAISNYLLTPEKVIKHLGEKSEIK